MVCRVPTCAVVRCSCIANHEATTNMTTVALPCQEGFTGQGHSVLRETRIGETTALSVPISMPPGLRQHQAGANVRELLILARLAPRRDLCHSRPLLWLHLLHPLCQTLQPTINRRKLLILMHRVCVAILRGTGAIVTV